MAQNEGNPPPYSPYDLSKVGEGQGFQGQGAPQVYGTTQQQPPAYVYPDYGYAQGYQQGTAGGYQALPQVPYSQQPGSTVIIQPDYQQVVYVGGCPACRVGVLEDDFTCLGICCAILFFPIGILCCLAMRQRRCTNCGAVFG